MNREQAKQLWRITFGEDGFPAAREIREYEDLPEAIVGSENTDSSKIAAEFLREWANAIESEE